MHSKQVLIPLHQQNPLFQIIRTFMSVPVVGKPSSGHCHPLPSSCSLLGLSPAHGDRANGDLGVSSPPVIPITNPSPSLRKTICFRYEVLLLRAASRQASRSPTWLLPLFQQESAVLRIERFIMFCALYSWGSLPLQLPLSFPHHMPLGHKIIGVRRDLERSSATTPWF